MHTPEDQMMHAQSWGPPFHLQSTIRLVSAKEKPYHCLLTDLDAQGLQVHCALQLTDAPGSGQECLGGNAAAVDAGSADVMPLNDCGLQALLA